MCTCEAYRIDKERWLSLPSLNIPRSHHASCYFPPSKEAYVFGGCKDADGYRTGSIESIRIGENEWRRLQLKVKKEWKPMAYIMSSPISSSKILIYGE